MRIDYYSSPIGLITLAADSVGLCGLWLDSQPCRAEGDNMNDGDTYLNEAKRWLDIYFAGSVPNFMPAVHFIGSDFDLSVWSKIVEIPYGETTTYGEIAAEIAAERGFVRMSAQAVGSAVGRNPVALIVPCHRVLAAGGAIGGYTGGVDKKEALLNIEKINLKKY